MEREMAQEQSRLSMDEAIKRFELDLWHRLEIFDAVTRTATVRSAVKTFAGNLAEIRARRDLT